MSNQKNQYCSHISDNMSKIQDGTSPAGVTCPMPMMCGMCPLIYMMYALGINPNQYLYGKSLYLDPRISED